MLTNYLKPYWRNFRKNLLNMLLAIGGFALGIAVFIVSLIFIHNELSFDGFHRNKDSIYRITYGENDSNGSAYTSFIMGNTLKENFGDVKVVRFNNAGGMRIPTSYEDKKFVETRFYFTDPEVFDVFSFNVTQGDPATCLKAPFTAVLTPAVASRYFGAEDPIGKSLKIDWVGTTYELEVTGVMEPPPADSHLQFEFLISNATAEQVFTPKTFFTDWTANFCYNYLYIPSGKESVVALRLQKIYTETVPSNQRSFNTRLQPLDRIHLHSKLMAEHSKNSDILYLYIAATLGVLIITVSFINYINILLATYSKRVKELGVRKVLGAHIGDISFQFATECILNLCLACVAAFVIILLASSFFSDMLNSNVSIYSLFSSWSVVGTPLLFLAVALTVYMIHFVTRIKPTELISGKSSVLTGQRGKSIMVGLQVGISIILIVGGLAVNHQVRFLEERELGFDKEHVLTVPYGRVITSKIELARNELVNQADIKSMTLSSQIPPSNLNFKVPCFPEGGNPDGNAEPWNVAMVVIDQHFVETFDLETVEGRSFSDEFRNDTTESFLINETFARQLNWKEAVGKRLEINFNPGTGIVEHKRGQVVGVIKDFHFESLHKPLTPILFIYKPTAFFYASFRLTPGDTQRKLEELKTRWTALFPDTPFDYYFINQRLETLYKVEKSWAKNIALFTLIAVLISLFGIFGLVSFLVQSKQKEFAVRKVLGASGFSIAQLISFRVTKIIFIAFVITAPVCYWMINSWLNTFAYRTDVGIDVFLFSLIAFLTSCGIVILGNLMKASRTSIVENLKSE